MDKKKDDILSITLEELTQLIERPARGKDSVSDKDNSEIPREAPLCNLYIVDDGRIPGGIWSWSV